jgi:glycosyltransferase involved in cell wall biosynthesis
VIAPSESIAALLRERGVRTPVEVLPTGVDTGSFGGGDGAAMRRRAGIPAEARVIGHLGRLAPEKNLRYLARAAAAAVDRDPETWFVVVGGGPSQARIRRTFKRKQLARRLRFLGKRTGDALVDAYHAMDVFAFASKTETQGMVLVEALSAGVPVVALDAPGAREVVQDGENGRLVEAEAAPGEFAQALLEALGREREEGEAFRRRARASAEPYDTARCVEKLDALYETVCAEEHETIDLDLTDRSSLLRSLEREWNLWANRFDAFGDAMGGGGTGGGEDSGDGEGDEDDEDDGGGSA